jgi:3-isopropylmalate/(R)-2-methylmalate dehydratase large subunit
MSQHLIITFHLLKEREQGIAGIEDDTSRIQVQTLDDNCKTFNIVEFGINDIRQGIAHVVGPEQGLTLPGMTVVCGDSHTYTWRIWLFSTRYWHVRS